MKIELQRLAEIALKRNGGSEAIKGFAYQFQYSIYKMLHEFNHCDDKQNHFKLEGVEDLDFYATNKEDNYFYQVKYSKNTYDTQKFKKDVLKNFLEVYFKVPESNFVLVTNKHIAKGNLHFLKNSNQKKELVTGNILAYWSEKCNEIKMKTESWEWDKFNINKFLSQIQFKTINEIQINSQVDKLLSKLLDSLKIITTNKALYENAIYNNVFLWSQNPQNIFYKDILQIIDKTRNAIAQGTINNVVKGEWLKSVCFTNNYDKDFVQSFFEGKPARPYHIGENLPAKREHWENKIIETFNKSNVTVIQASSGQGKSTLAWQVIFNLKNKGYHPYELFECKRTEEIGELVQFINERVKIGEKPIIVLDGLNENIKEWKELVKRSSKLPIKFLITTREEDWFYYGTTNLPATIKHINISMDYTEARQIYNQFKREGKLFSGINNWQPAWEKVEKRGLLIEFVYYITHGKMMYDRLKEQCKNLNKHPDKIEILRLISVATLCNVVIKTTKLVDFINGKYPEIDINTTLESLNKEYQLSIENQNYIEGLHPVRSEHLSEILHRNIPINSTLKKLFHLIDDENLFIFSSQSLLLLTNSKEKEDFLDYLARESKSLNYSTILTIINGVFSNDAKLYWKKNQSIYDHLFEGNGGLIYALDLRPWGKPIFKPLFDNILNSGNEHRIENTKQALKYYDDIEKFEAKKSNTYKYLRVLFENLYDTELHKNLNGLSQFARWLDRFDLECQLIQQVTVKHLKLNFQILDIDSFGNLLWAMYKFNSKIFNTFFEENKDRVIAKLKVSSNTLTIREEENHLEINYFYDVNDIENLNHESVKRIELFSLYFPYLSNFKTKAIYLPLSIMTYLLDSHDPSVKNINTNNGHFIDKFTLQSNQIWLKRISENHEYNSLYDWQKFIYTIRTKLLELIKYSNDFLEKIFEGKQQLANKKSELLDKKKKDVLLLQKKKKSVHYDDYFPEINYIKPIKSINSWLSSLNNVVNQLFPVEDRDIHLLYVNLIDVEKDLFEVQTNFNSIQAQTIKYFDTDELCEKETYWYNRFLDTIIYYKEKKPNCRCTNAKEAIQEWKKNKELKLNTEVTDFISKFENNTGIKCIKPTQTLTSGLQKSVIIGLEGIQPTVFDEVFDVILFNSLEFIAIDIDYLILVFVEKNQLIQNNGVSIPKFFLQETDNAFKNDTEFELGISRPLPIQITEEHLNTLPNITFAPKVNLSSDIINRIILKLWKLSEIRKRITSDIMIELKWKKEMEDEIKQNLQQLTNSIHYKQQPKLIKQQYNLIIENVLERNEIIEDSRFEELYQEVIKTRQDKQS